MIQTTRDQRQETEDRRWENGDRQETRVRREFSEVV